MRIALINPILENETCFHPPLGLCYLAAYLIREGHQVIIIDREVLRYKNKNTINYETARILEEYRPQIVGATATTPQIPDVVNTLKLVKDSNTNIKTILGGIHASVYKQQVLQDYPQIDYIVYGEGEITLSELAKEKPIKDILGLIFRDYIEDQPIEFTNPPRPLIQNLDDIPIPARHLLDMDYYTKSGPIILTGIELRALHTYTARGCPFACSFCASTYVFTRKLRFNSPERVIEEVEHLINTYHIKGLNFLEDAFFTNKERAKRICELFIEKGLNKKIVWGVLLRSDMATEDTLKLLKDAGCVQVNYGFESGSQRVLDLMNKGTTVEQNLKAAQLTKKYGMRIFGNFMVGIPGETKEDMLLTFDFIKKVEPDYMQLAKYTPFPGSKMFNDMIKNDIKLSKKLTEYTIGGDEHRDIFCDVEEKEYHKLVDDFYKSYIRPLIYRKYLAYNLLRHPISVIKTAFIKLKEFIPITVVEG